MLICRFSIQDHHDLKLYRLSSTIKNFVEIYYDSKKTDGLACIGNDQNALRGQTCYLSKNLHDQIYGKKKKQRKCINISDFSSFFGRI